MALWGNNDNVLTANAGIITASGFNGEVTGSATTFTNYAVGQTLTLGVGQTAGFGVIKSIASDTELQLHTTLGGSLAAEVNTFTGSSDSFIVGDRPVSAASDPSFSPTSSINFVDLSSLYKVIVSPYAFFNSSLVFAKLL